MTQELHVRRVAVVTGGAGGLGAEIAERLANDGFDLALLDLDGAGLERVAAEIAAHVPGAAALTIALDLADEAHIEQAFMRIDARFGRIDALVNTAGGSGAALVRKLSDISLDIWRRVMDSNVTSTFLCCRGAVPIMERRGYGRIVNFSSAVANGKSGPAGTVGARLPYAASKGAVNSLTRQLAKDLGRTGITVNAVSPGLVLPAAGRVRDIFEALPQEAKHNTWNAIPVGRTGTGTEIAAAVAYLVSEAAGFTTGAILSVDGGEV